MTWDFLFFLQTSLITIITMACVHAFLHRNKLINTEIRTLFLALSTILMLEGVEAYADHVLSTATDGTYGALRMVVSAFGYILRPLMLYLVLLIMMREVHFRYKKLILGIPTIITAIIAVLSFFTKWVIYYDEFNNFHGGPLRYGFFVMLLIYFVMVLVVNIVNWKKNKAEGRVLFAVIVLLSLDWVMSLHYELVSMHTELESISTLLYFMYFLTNFHEETIEEKEQEHIDSEQRLTKDMLDQSIETLAYTIDAKDKYTKGHSSRVAKYSRMIAGLAGKSDEDCRQIYLAGLLHDIGKISIHDSIINKQGKLTDEEYNTIKTHPAKGALILEKMQYTPYLQNGAKYHHERFDGKGYPCGLKGLEIPDMARIIAVADAYDAMTSYRSYRPAMDQNLVKQEIWKGMGTQFDPFYAKLMIALIDADVNYEMREIPNKQDEIIFDNFSEKITWPSSQTEVEINYGKPRTMISEELNTLASFIQIEDKWCDASAGYSVAPEPKKIRFRSTTRPEAEYVWCTPIVLVYFSDNGEVLGPNYNELGVFMSAGYGWQAGLSLYEYSGMFKEPGFESWDTWLSSNKEGLDYTVCAHMEDNLVVLSIENGQITMGAHLAVPHEYKERIRISISGNMCDITDLVPPATAI